MLLFIAIPGFIWACVGLAALFWPPDTSNLPTYLAWSESQNFFIAAFGTIVMSLIWLEIRLALAFWKFLGWILAISIWAALFYSVKWLVWK